MIDLRELCRRKANYVYRCDTPDCPIASDVFADFEVVGCWLYCHQCAATARQVERRLRPNLAGMAAGSLMWLVQAALGVLVRLREDMASGMALWRYSR